MPSKSAHELFQIATNVATALYRITITDPWYKTPGGNWKEPDLANQSSSMGGLFAAIKARQTDGTGSQTSGLRSASSAPIGRQVISMPSAEWLRQGSRAIMAGHGICTDCAAAAAYAFADKADAYEFRMEIISTGSHAFLIVNRDDGSAVNQPANWGGDAFGIDVWMQNQFPPGQVDGAFWVSDQGHDVARFIVANAARLNVDAALCEPVGTFI
jgi:hypothetical protein